MSNIFDDVLTNAKAAEEKYIGPDYPYYKYIRTPSEMGMSGAGNLTQLGKDIDGLVNYVELLVSGGGKASSTGQPLGNKFFLKTGGKCTNKTSGQDEDKRSANELKMKLEPFSNVMIDKGRYRVKLVENFDSDSSDTGNR